MSRLDKGDGVDLHLFARRAVLGVAGNRAVAALVTRHGLRLGASRFVAGETLDDAVEAVRRLNAEGICATLDHLGEGVDDAAEARSAARAYIEALERIAAAGIDSNVSLKLTQMGLDLSRDLCLENMRAILAAARDTGNFVRIDMESSAYTQLTLDIYRELRAAGFGNVGVVIQSYLYRSEQDLAELAAMNANVRLVKGAYAEPPAVAFPTKREVDENLMRLIEFYLASGNYTAVATHDAAIIRKTIAWTTRHNVPRDRFEFQMLYGIRREMQRELARAGYRMRVYVPYGSDWYPYFTRRLAERPANLWFVLRNLLRA